MPPNLDERLNEWRTQEVPVVTKSVTGDEFSGRISWFDNYNISLDTEDGEVVLFKGTMAYLRPTN